MGHHYSTSTQVKQHNTVPRPILTTARGTFSASFSNKMCSKKMHTINRKHATGSWRNLSVFAQSQLRATLWQNFVDANLGFAPGGEKCVALSVKFSTSTVLPTFSTHQQLLAVLCTRGNHGLLYNYSQNICK